MEYRFYFLVLLAGMAGCRQPYQPPVIVAHRHYLVVEGYINAGVGNTTITLTRTRNLSDTGYLNVSGVPDSLFELGAAVSVEDKTGDSYPLPEIGKGQYGGLHLVLNTQRQYRLLIKTGNGSEYASPYQAVIPAPVIDSLYWQLEGDGVHIYMDVHNDDAASRYYRWTYNATWEFHTWFHSDLKYIRADTAIVKRYPSEYVDTCWRTALSTNIFIDNATKLTENRLSREPVTFIETHSEALSVLYSMRVKVFSISKEEYQFWELMKKNTEEMGSIFDPQPSVTGGNIHCITHPDEPVIGYIAVGVAAEKRLWLSSKQLPASWNINGFNCDLITVANVKDSLMPFLNSLPPVYTPVSAVVAPHGDTIAYKLTRRRCADCTQRGTLSKPAFWP